jgi:hypothetical protein
MEQWDHTAYMMATMLNCRMGVKRKTKPIDVHPLRSQPVMMVKLKSVKSTLMGMAASTARSSGVPVANPK